MTDQSPTELALTREFGLTTATPVQRAACRARDGYPLRELANHAEVIQAFGGAEAVAALPSERGIKPTHFYNISSARCAKTTMAVASALVDALHLDLSGMAPGEVPRVTIISLKLDVADVPLTRLKGTIDAHPALKRMVISETAQTLTLRNLQGRPIELAVIAGGKAGGGLAARWSAGLIADEAPRMNGREDGVANLDDALSVIRERLLPGAQIQCLGSPWAPSGPVYDAVGTHFGKPSDDFVVMRTIGPHGNPSYWTRERLERLQRTDEIAYRINAFGDFIDPEQGLLSPIAIAKNVRKEKLDLPPNRALSYAAAVDPSEASGSGNAFTLVIIEREGRGEEARFRVALAREFRSGSPSQIWSQIASHCKRYGVSTVVSDQWGGEAQREIAKQHEIDLRKRTTTARTKLEDFQNLATLIHSDRLELPEDKTLLDDLRSVRLVTTQSGQSIHLPRTGDGRHCDYAPAVAAALRGAFHGGRASSNGHVHMQQWMNAQPWAQSRYSHSSRGDVERVDPVDYALDKGLAAARRRYGDAEVEQNPAQFAKYK